MIKCVMSAMGSSVVENTPHSFVVTSTVFSITASTVGLLSIPCQPSSVIDLLSKKVGIVHVLQPHVKTGFSFNSQKLLQSLSLLTYNRCIATGKFIHHFLYLLATFVIFHFNTFIMIVIFPSSLTALFILFVS